MARLSEFIARWGGLGLGLVAFLDSSFIPLPGVVDGGILFLAAQSPDRWLYYALTPTIGSMAGSFVLYALARKGGHALLKKGFKEHHVERGREAFRKYGLLAIVVPAILPPPTPFKLFVLLAGVTDVSPGAFLLANFIGRGFRYSTVAYLGHRFGSDAGSIVRANLGRVSLWLAIAVAVGGLAWVLWRRRRAS